MIWASPKRIQTLHEAKHAAASRGANPEEESSGRASFGGVRSRPYAVAPSVHVRRMPFAPTPRPIEEGGGRTRRSVPPTLRYTWGECDSPLPTDGRDEAKPLRECLAGISTARGAGPQKRRGTSPKKDEGAAPPYVETAPFSQRRNLEAIRYAVAVAAVAPAALSDLRCWIS